MPERILDSRLRPKKELTDKPALASEMKSNTMKTEIRFIVTDQDVSSERRNSFYEQIFSFEARQFNETDNRSKTNEPQRFSHD